MTNNLEKTADLGDFMKTFACTAVILQSVLSFALTKHPSSNNQIFIGVLYDLVKFTAPVFIFGILYSTIRTDPYAKIADYPNYAKKQFSTLFVPTFWWTLLYLIFLPSVQQMHHYRNLSEFVWQFINGNAAPHLWYNTMMLQFIILMPIFWMISDITKKSAKIAVIVLILSLIIYLVWIEFYYMNVFNGSMKHQLYLLDRIFLSFFIYAILGVLFVNYRWNIQQLLYKIRWIIILITMMAFIEINLELIKFSGPLKLNNAPYYKLSMVIYDIGIILMIALLAFYQIDKNSKVLPTIHFLSTYAYRAYLSNVFWLVIIWNIFNFQTSHLNLWLIIIIAYLITWVCSFTSAYVLNKIWSFCKKRLFDQS